MKDLATDLSRLEAEHLYRQRRVTDSPQQPEIVVDGRKVISFCSNDYLGLSNHPEVIEAFRNGLTEYGAGSGASHLISGHSRAHHDLEHELASFVNREQALFFSTGYMANLGIVQALMKRGDHVLEDRLNHASLYDAAQISRARLVRYPHTDLKKLQQRLTGASGNERLIMTDAVFSMDGDIAPLPAMAALASRTDSWLMADDAHGFGVLGKNGAGSLEHFSLTQEDVPILMATLGKAAGTFGAFVAGSHELIETLIQSARTYIYTTATPPALAQATRASLKIIQQESWRREKLASLIATFRSGAEQLGLDLLPSTTPIQPLVVGNASKTLGISQQLFEQGILVSAIRPPTVPAGTSRLRITFSASHTEEHVQRLLMALENNAAGPNLG